ncbi:MAG: hypothetical protein KGH69_01625 [Candidatus Micrarchaeota archaeon]|nr:hypothetical protein [Candidatus Micrarchaeota archaeon]
MASYETQTVERTDAIRADAFDMRHTFESGQPLTFHADYSEDGFSRNLAYSTGIGRISVSSSGNILHISHSGRYSRATARVEVIKRMGLNDDMERIYEGMNTDPFMDSAIRNFKGMRITENDSWETTMCFILSQFNNIKRIRLITRRMIERFGQPYSDGGTIISMFPSAEAVAGASIGDINACGTGFRGKYLKSAAKVCSENLDLKKLYGMDYASAKEALMELDGVGDKVADCILLFGYHKTEAFPIDTWIKRIIETVYFKGRNKSIKELHKFAERRWQPELLGYVQQYLFWNGRSLKVGT